MGVRQCKVSLETLKKRFEKILSLQLQIEGEGQVWTSLEAKLMLHCGYKVIYSNSARFRLHYYFLNLHLQYAVLSIIIYFTFALYR